MNLTHASGEPTPVTSVILATANVSAMCQALRADPSRSVAPEPASGVGLALTGERTVPGIAQENYWFRRHEIVYQRLLPWCRGAVVLDAGTGEGYGANLVASVAARVVGIDYDVAAATHVRAVYPQVTMLRANLAALPVVTASVDVVVCFQVIEHLWDQGEFLAECRRVLRPGGQLLLSTPNRLTFTPGRVTPLNPFHTRELCGDELAGLLTDAGFTCGTLAGLHHGPHLAALDLAWGGSIVDVQVQHAVADRPWPAQLRADVAGVQATDFALRTTDLDASLDLIAVATTPTVAQ